MRDWCVVTDGCNLACDIPFGGGHMIVKTLIVRVNATNEKALAKIKEHIFFISLVDRNHPDSRVCVESVHQVGK